MKGIMGEHLNQLVIQTVLIDKLPESFNSSPSGCSNEVRM